MAQFVDSEGRPWKLKLGYRSLVDVRDETQVNLGTLTSLDAICDLIEDPISFVNVLACLTRQQRIQVGVTEEDFGESLIGDVYEQAVTAFLKALADFGPSHRRIQVRELVALIQKTRTLTTEEQEKISLKIATAMASLAT